MPTISNESDAYYAAGQERSGAGGDKIKPRRVDKPPKKRPATHQEKMQEYLAQAAEHIHKSLFFGNRS